MPNPYLESKVRTASQPELQLMLLDGALRFGRAAQEQMGQGHAASGGDAMQRTLDILEALVNGFASGTHELSPSLEEQFAYLYREAAAARIEDDPLRLQRVLDLLTYHRETWHLACEKYRADRGSSASAPPTAPPHRAPAVGFAASDAAFSAGSFSLEA
jgi:flagellar protein FliS